jgi:hypothetical protein
MLVGAGFAWDLKGNGFNRDAELLGWTATRARVFDRAL